MPFYGALMHYIGVHMDKALGLTCIMIIIDMYGWALVGRTTMTNAWITLGLALACWWGYTVLAVG